MATELAKNVSIALIASPIDLHDIPRLLFDEVAKEVGMGEPFKCYVDDEWWLMRTIDPAHKAIGFPGAIGFRERQEVPRFGFWPRVPKDGDDIRASYSVYVCPTSGGIWTPGTGNLMRRDLFVDADKIYPDDRSAQFIGMLIIRTGQMRQHASIRLPKAFWEGPAWDDEH